MLKNTSLWALNGRQRWFWIQVEATMVLDTSGGYVWI